jgi:hypothetical protein
MRLQRCLWVSARLHGYDGRPLDGSLLGTTTFFSRASAVPLTRGTQVADISPRRDPPAASSFLKLQNRHEPPGEKRRKNVEPARGRYAKGRGLQ